MIALYELFEPREQVAGVVRLRSSLLVFRLSGAVRHDANGGTVQPHEVSHLFGPMLVNVNGTVNPLVGKESRTGWLNYLNNLLNSKPVVL